MARWSLPYQSREKRGSSLHPPGEAKRPSEAPQLQNVGWRGRSGSLGNGIEALPAAGRRSDARSWGCGVSGSADETMSASASDARSAADTGLLLMPPEVRREPWPRRARRSSNLEPVAPGRLDEGRNTSRRRGCKFSSFPNAPQAHDDRAERRLRAPAPSPANDPPASTHMRNASASERTPSFFISVAR